jgi:pimeloyl-ACP methyl ester carboxylesterase
MTGWTSLVGMVLLTSTGPVAARFVQVHPLPGASAFFTRSEGQLRAVVLLHGLKPRPFNEVNVTKAEFHSWQKPGSTLVKALAGDADVFAFAYSQNIAVDQVAHVPALHEALGCLRQLGYQELVLVGHSAGGVIARRLVEDYPDAGVTKVIQVCTPNGGSSLSQVTAAVRAKQEVFLQSLTKDARHREAQRRADIRIPPTVQFVCVVGTGGGVGDGIVNCHSQWSEDLQQQLIPAVPLLTTHFLAMRTRQGARKVAELVREPQPRWNADQVAAARQRMLKVRDDAPANRNFFHRMYKPG